jgi:hypothetical protein
MKTTPPIIRIGGIIWPIEHYVIEPELTEHPPLDDRRP